MGRYAKPSPADVSTFRDAIRAIAPPWLLDWTGDRYLYTIGLAHDAMAESLAYSVLARFPQSGIPGILPWLGRDRKIDRGPFESDDGYALRIKRARRVWRNAGGAFALMSQVQAYFAPIAPTVRIVSNVNAPMGINTWYTLSPTGEKDAGVLSASPGWWWGDDITGPERWWRFWVIIGEEVPSFTAVTGTPVPIDLNRIIDKWSPPHAFMQTGIHTYDNSLFVPPFTSPVTTGDWTNPANRDNVNAEYWNGPTP